MMPLPDLSPLPPSPPVFDSTADDWVTQFADLQGTHDSLTAALGSSENDLNASSGGITSAIDTISGALDTAEQIFGQLAAEQQALDLTQTVLDVLSQDNALEAGLSGFSPDIGALAGPFTQAITDLFNLLLKPLINYIIAFVQWVIGNLEELFAFVSLQEPFAIGPQGGVFFQFP